MFRKEGSEKTKWTKTQLKKRFSTHLNSKLILPPMKTKPGCCALSKSLSHVSSSLGGNKRRPKTNVLPVGQRWERQEGGWCHLGMSECCNCHGFFFVEYACHQPKFSESHDKFGYEKATWFGLCLECFWLKCHSRWEHATWVNCKTSQTRNLMLNGCLCYLSHCSI